MNFLDGLTPSTPPDYFSDSPPSLANLTLDAIIKTGNQALDAFDKINLFYQEKLNDLEDMKIANHFMAASACTFWLLLCVSTVAIYIIGALIVAPLIETSVGLFILGFFGIVITLTLLILLNILFMVAVISPIFENYDIIDDEMEDHEDTLDDYQSSARFLEVKIEKNIDTQEKFKQFFTQTNEISEHLQQNDGLTLEIQLIKKSFETKESLTAAVNAWKESPTMSPIIETCFQKFKANIHFGNMLFHKDIYDVVMESYNLYSLNEYQRFNKLIQYAFPKAFIENKD